MLSNRATVNMATGDAFFNRTPQNCDDSSSQEDDSDEWLFSSIKRYQCLHMFELQHPTQTIEWVGDDRVCVGCLHPDGTTELLELCLPDKLTAEKQKEGLKKGRDFNFLAGGFHDSHVWQIRHIPNTRKIVTSDFRSNHIQVWDLGQENSDLLKMNTTIDNLQTESTASEVAVCPDDSQQVAFGTSIQNLCVADLHSGAIEYDMQGYSMPDRISSLHYVDDFCLLACARNSGDLWWIDTRQSPSQTQHVPHHAQQADASWVAALNCTSTFLTQKISNTDSGRYIAKYSTEGELNVYDVSNLSGAIYSVDTKLRCSNLEKRDVIGTCLQFSSQEDNLISISGMDGNVYIYDSSQWNGKPQGHPATPIFTHQGHTACSEHPKETVTMTHLWHRSKPELLLSTASDGSLHAWSYVI